jgi:hypothetical protein
VGQDHRTSIASKSIDAGEQGVARHRLDPTVLTESTRRLSRHDQGQRAATRSEVTCAVRIGLMHEPIGLDH